MPGMPESPSKLFTRRSDTSPWRTASGVALLALALLCACLAPAWAGPGEDFNTARAAFKELSQDDKGGRYRSNWQALETKFLTIYKNSPNGDTAPKALYYVGRVNEELGRRSFLPTDFNVALDYYARVVEKFADHTWADDAQWRMARVQIVHLKDDDAAKELCSAGLKRFPKGDMRSRFTQCLADLNDPPAEAKKAAEAPSQSTGANAGDATAAAKQVAAIDPAATAPAQKQSAAGDQKQPAATKAVHVVRKKDSAKEATPNRPAMLLGVRHQSSDEYTRIILQLDKPVQYVHRTLPPNKQKKLPHRLYLDLKNVHKSPKVQSEHNIADGILRRVRSGQNTPFVTRVVLDLTDMTKFKVFGIDSDDGYRLLVDVYAGPPDAPSPMAGKPLPVIQAEKRPVSEPRKSGGPGDDDEREKAGAPPHIRDPNAVVVKTPSVQTSRPVAPVAATRDTFATAPAPKNAAPEKPAGKQVAKAAIPDATLAPLPLPKPPEYAPPKGAEKQAENLVEQLGLTVGVIMLDPGHGGKDPGAFVGNVKEKDINLRFAKILGKLLEKEGFEVLYTRTDDSFIPLEERTAMANVKKADLFISLHVNAYATDKVHGMETYFLDLATSDDAVRVAARENAVSTKKISDLQFILTDLMLNSKMKESKALAKNAHKNALKSLRAKTKVKDMGVRSAPFYVLMGARMPSILVELGYITNDNERSNLTNEAYLTRQAQGLAQGVLQYKKQIERYAGL